MTRKQQVNEKKTKAFKLQGDLTLHYEGEMLANASELKVLGVSFKFVQVSFLLEVPEKRSSRRSQWRAECVFRGCRSTFASCSMACW